jgi:aryl-alcohol dehydrogenase-like predicted oxidoreductase
MLDDPLKVTSPPPIILGTVQLGRNYGIANRNGVPPETISLDILTAAANAGVEIFDTAPNYGGSEALIGRFLDSWPGKEPRIITKLVSGVIRDAATEKEVYSLIKDSLLGSVKKLRSNRPPELIMQNAADAVDNPRVVDCLLKLKQEGLAGEVGLSVYQERDLEFILDHDGLQLVQAPFNIFDRRLEGYLAELARLGKTVWSRSVFLQGLFFLDPKYLPQAVQPAAPYLEDLRHLSIEIGLSIEKLAFLYARDTQGLDGLVIGVESMDQLERNFELLELPALTLDQRKTIEKEFPAVPEAVYNPILWKTWS